MLQCAREGTNASGGVEGIRQGWKDDQFYWGIPEIYVDVREELGGVFLAVGS